MLRLSTRRIAAFAGIVTVGVILLTSGAIESSRADSRPACTYGVSSLGPVILEGGRIVGGSTTPVTEACLP